MRLSIFSFALALLLPAGMLQTQTSVPARTSHYTITQNDKTVGSAEFTATPISGGYTITSHGNLHLSKLNYNFTNTQNLDRALNLVSDQITGTVNGSEVTVSIKADPTGRQFNINVSAKGKNTQNTVDRHQHLALLPDLDPAGYMLLTRIGLENPQVSWALIPKENGLLVPTIYQRQPDVRGRLGGHDIMVQHTTATVSAENAINVELFHTQDGRLLEADLPQQNFYVSLDGFTLTNRPKFAPPRSPEHPPQQPGEPQDSEPQADQ
jgi:hypothetical protein